MPDLDSLRWWVGATALMFAIVAFIMFIMMISDWRKKGTKEAETLTKSLVDVPAKGLVAPTPAEVADLIKALASLSESLVKAGPAIWSLIAAVLFLAIAAIAAGVMGGGDVGRGNAGSVAERTANSRGNSESASRGPNGRGGTETNERSSEAVEDENLPVKLNGSR